MEKKITHYNSLPENSAYPVLLLQPTRDMIGNNLYSHPDLCTTDTRDTHFVSVASPELKWSVAEASAELGDTTDNEVKAVPELEAEDPDTEAALFVSTYESPKKKQKQVTLLSTRDGSDSFEILLHQFQLNFLGCRRFKRRVGGPCYGIG